MSFSDETRRVDAPRCVMLVDVPEVFAVRITIALGMTALRANHARAACERMVTMRPLVVVVGGEPSVEEMAALEENTVAIAAQLVVLAKPGVLEQLELHLEAARRAAETSRTDASKWIR